MSKIPDILYHGTFFPDYISTTKGREPFLVHPQGLIPVIYTTTSLDWANHFSLLRQVRYRESPGRSIIFQIKIASLSDEDKNRIISPDQQLETDPICISTEERIRIGEWRLPFIVPHGIALSIRREFRSDPMPDLSYAEVALLVPADL